jgi:hypothetical protein
MDEAADAVATGIIDSELLVVGALYLPRCLHIPTKLAHSRHLRIVGIELASHRIHHLDGDAEVLVDTGGTGAGQKALVKDNFEARASLGRHLW